MSESRNNCTFKQCCRKCNKVEVNERPRLCIEIQCEDYQPCPSCGQNRTLHEVVGKGRICKNCASLTVVRVNEARRELKKVLDGEGETNPTTSPINVRGLGSLSIPGEPPDELSEDEKSYYSRRWQEYEGYYRNPSAYYNVHQLILLEIHSSYLNKKLIEARGELQSELSRELQVTVNLRKIVSDQLPDKEAEDVMDDEKSLAMIYERYIEEKKLRTIGPVSRVFRKDTLALAPHLLFEIKPEELLERAGFKTVDIEKILPRLDQFCSDKKKTQQEVLEFFGFNLNEEFAIDTRESVEGIDTDDFDPEEELYGDTE